MKQVVFAIIIIKAIILLLGGAITYIAFKAYRRTRTKSIQLLGIGFGVLTFGAFLTGMATQIFDFSLELGVLTNSVFVAIALAIIMLSLHHQ